MRCGEWGWVLCSPQHLQQMNKVVTFLFGILAAASVIQLATTDSKFTAVFSLYALGLGSAILVGALCKAVQEHKYKQSKPFKKSPKLWRTMQ